MSTSLKEKYYVMDTSSYLELSNLRSHLGEKCCFPKETRRNNAKSKQQKSGPFCVSLTYCFTNKTYELSNFAATGDNNNNNNKTDDKCNLKFGAEKEPS